MDARRLLVIFAYVVSFSLFESLFLMAFVVFLSLLFPRRMFKEVFVAQGSLQVLVISLITYFVRQRIEMFQKFEIWELLTVPVVALSVIVCSIFLLSWILRRFQKLQRIVVNLADRLTIFAYLYLPLGLAGLTLVIIRNLS